MAPGQRSAVLDQALAAFNPAEALEILSEIIGIDSIWGNEKPLATHLAQRFEEWGFQDVRLVDVPAGRPSLVARVPGSGGGRTLLLNGHIDMYELAADWTLDPWTLTARDGKLHGGGISDMKAGLAAIVAAGKHLLDTKAPLKGDLLISCVSVHFEGGVGTRALLDAGLSADAAIVAEPSNMEMIVANRGGAYFDVTTLGKQAHSTAPSMGVNAISKMARVIEALERLELPYEPHPLLPGAPLMNVGTIHGGYAHNQIPDRCTISVDFRILPSQTPQAVKQQVEAMITALHNDDPDLRAEVAFNKFWLSGPRVPFEADPQWEILGVVERASQAATGRLPQRQGMAAWLDAAVLAPVGIPCVNIGPGGLPYTFTDEYVLQDEYLNAVRTYVAAALDFCN